MLPGFVCLPSPDCHFLQGRILQPEGTLGVLAVDQLRQHECLSPSDGSFVLMDVAVVDYVHRREALAMGVDRTGGTLCSLGCSGGPIRFIPRVCYTDDHGASLAKVLFPDLAISAYVAVVEGHFEIHSSDLTWKPMGLSSASGDDIHIPGILELMGRTWADCSESGASATGTHDSVGDASCDSDSVVFQGRAGSSSSFYDLQAANESASDGWISARRQMP
jgi:hypothetical protein